MDEVSVDYGKLPTYWQVFLARCHLEYRQFQALFDYPGCRMNSYHGEAWRHYSALSEWYYTRKEYLRYLETSAEVNKELEQRAYQHCFEYFVRLEEIAHMKKYPNRVFGPPRYGEDREHVSLKVHQCLDGLHQDHSRYDLTMSCK